MARQTPQKRPLKEDTADKKESSQLLSLYGSTERQSHPISALEWAPSRLSGSDRPLLASASANGSVNIYSFSLTSGEVPSSEEAAAPKNNATVPTHTLTGHARGINDVSWNPLAPILASASDDKTIRLWDVNAEKSILECHGHNNYVFCLHQHHHLIVSGSFDETIKLWDVRTGQCLQTIPAHSDPVTSVQFSRDGTCIVSGSHDGLVRIWDTLTGECLKTLFAAGNPPVASVTYSPNSKYVLAATLDHGLRLWPVRQTGTHHCSKTYTHRSYVNRKYSIPCGFLPDGNVVAGSETGDVLVYDLQTREARQILSLQDSSDSVLALASHAKHPLVASGGMDQCVSVWATAGYLQ